MHFDKTRLLTTPQALPACYFFGKSGDCIGRFSCLVITARLALNTNKDRTMDPEYRANQAAYESIWALITGATYGLYLASVEGVVASSDERNDILIYADYLLHR
jgi:hypothetical protein